MWIAYVCVLVAALLPYVWVFVAQRSTKRYDNHNPRGSVGQQLENQRLQRAHGAHLNAFEAFAPFAAGVVLAQLAGVAVGTINALAVAFIALRVLHGLFYLADKPPLRSLSWLLGFACAAALIVLAALRVG